MLLELIPSMKEAIWAGQRLKELKKLEASGQWAEAWEVSTHPSGISHIRGHSDNLSELLQRHHQPLLPYLIKLIDTADYLSVQVHPDDEYAQKFEKSLGKQESWLILDVDPVLSQQNKAGIYLGFKDPQNIDSLPIKVSKGEDISALLNFFPVTAGDYFEVPAGTIHAIGPGVTLLEVQQSSDITYRFWDWNRADHKGESRELHTKEALDVLRPDLPRPSHIKKNLFESNQSLIPLLETSQFQTWLYSYQKGRTHQHAFDFNKTISFYPLTDGVTVIEQGNSHHLNRYQAALSFSSSCQLVLSENSHCVVVCEK